MIRAPRLDPNDGGPLARAAITAAMAGTGLVAFLGYRPAQPWLLFFTAALVALAAAGTVRGHPRWQGRHEATTIAFMFLPAITTVAVGAFADRVLDGYARPLVGSAGAAAVGLSVFAEYHAVDQGARVYGPVKIILAGTTYGAVFALSAVMFDLDIAVATSALAIGLASWLLATSLLREEGAIGMSSVLAGFAVGASLAELRFALYFFPVEDVLGGALILAGFHLAVGIVHHLLDHDLAITTLAEYVAVVAAGVGVIVVGAAVI